MGQAVVLAILGAATGAGTYALRHRLPAPLLLVLSHAVATSIVISVASSNLLAKSTPWILGKDTRTGNFVRGSRLLTWPFHVGLHTRLRLRRARSSEPLVQQVADGWFIGAWPSSPAQLPNSNCSVIDCTAEYGKTHSQPYLCLPTWDTQGVAPADIGQGVGFALQQRRLGRDVLVHCAHGHGRSCQVLLACLVAANICKTYQEALVAVQAVRPKCKLNKIQRKHLESYLQRLNTGVSY